MSQFTVRPLGYYHMAPTVIHAVLQDGIAIAWTKSRAVAELISSCLNVASAEDDNE